MKKSTITKKVTSITLAAMLALTAYMPAAAYATEETDDTATQTASDSAQPVAEEVEQQAEPVTVDQAPEKDQAPVAEENVPTVKDQAPAADKKAPAAEENPVAKSQAPAAEETTPAAEDEPAAKSPVPAAEETAPAAEDDPAQTEEDQPVAEESPYGVATGNWGYGNDRQGTRWDEYTKDGETILVFTIVGDTGSDEDYAVTQLLDQEGNSVREDLQGTVTQIVFETGITGIGWMALYSSAGYDPLYTPEYTEDKTKTDVFNSFTSLTTVTPCETIMRIGWSAFRKCSNLSNFDFTQCPQLVEIMNQAFSDCPSLNNVDLSNCNLLTTIAWSAFNGAGRGKDASLALPTDGALSIIGGYAFYQYAKNNSEGTEVDFSGVADSVTQILQNAFNGTHIVGEISGFENLDTVGNNAFKNSWITYIPYEPPQDEPGEDPVVGEDDPVAGEDDPIVGEDDPIVGEDDPIVGEDDPIVGEDDPVVVEDDPVVGEDDPVVGEDDPVVGEDDPVIGEDDPVVGEDDPVIGENDPIVGEDDPVIGENDLIVGEDDDPVVEGDDPASDDPAVEPQNEDPQDETGTDPEPQATVEPKATGGSAGNAAVTSAALTSIEDSDAPVAATAADTVTISEADVPMTDSLAGASLAYILGGLAAALLLALAAMKGNERRKTGSNY